MNFLSDGIIFGDLAEMNMKIVDGGDGMIGIPYKQWQMATI